MSILSFKRKERKFILTRSKMEEILPFILEHMNYDKYCKNGKWYLIRNIYLDTEDNHLIRLSVMKPYYKEKIRIRKYGTYGDGRTDYFLEIKKKVGGIVTKRRIELTKEELDSLLENGIIPHREGYLEKQVLNEISYFLSYRKVKKALFLSYERLAFVGKEDKTLRLTFDTSLLARRDNLDIDEYDENMKHILEENLAIMEIKANGAMPLWIVDMLSAHKIYRTSYSKYGKQYEKEIKMKRSIVL